MPWKKVNGIWKRVDEDGGDDTNNGSAVKKPIMMSLSSPGYMLFSPSRSQINDKMDKPPAEGKLEAVQKLEFDEAAKVEHVPPADVVEETPRTVEDSVAKSEEPVPDESPVAEEAPEVPSAVTEKAAEEPVAKEEMAKDIVEEPAAEELVKETGDKQATVEEKWRRVHQPIQKIQMLLSLR